MTKILIATLSALFLLAGCASNAEYYKSVDSANARQVEIANAQSAAETARYAALAQIAQSGDQVAKVAATMALAMGGNQNARQTAPIAPQQPQVSEALQWAQVFSTPLTQLGMGYYGMKTNMNASNNATALGVSTNQTFGQMNATVGTAVGVALTSMPAPVVVMQPTPTVVNANPTVINANPTVVNANPTVVQPAVICTTGSC